MPEKEFEVKTVGIDYVCDVCGVGTMSHTGIVLSSNPPQYPHKCWNCGHEQTYYSRYPRTETRTF